MEDSHTNLIILDGISGAGKTTLKHAISNARGFKDYIFHRFTPTEWVYSVINRRHVNLELLKTHEEKIQDIWNVTLVTLTCDPFKALERKATMANEVIEPEIAIANKLFVVYHNYLTAFKRKIIINTNDKTIEECTNLILNRVLS